MYREFYNTLMLKLLSPKKKNTEASSSSNVVMNINNLLIKDFNNMNVEIYGTYDKPLFKAKDIGKLLGIANIRTTILNYNEKQKVVILVNTPGGKQETTFLTEQGLYKVLMKSNKKIAIEFQDWICEIMDEIRHSGKYELEEKLNGNRKLLEMNITKLRQQEEKELAYKEQQKNMEKLLKEKEENELKYKQELEAKSKELLKFKQKTYSEVEKNQHIYILKTDGGIKVGKTKDMVTKRIKGLQTGNVNKIEILYDYITSNADILERLVHYILDDYRCESGREFFNCDVKYIKRVIRKCGALMHTLKSSYEHTPIEELDGRLKAKICYKMKKRLKNKEEKELEEKMDKELDKDAGKISW